MIRSFADKETEKLWEGKPSKISASIKRQVLKKQRILNASPSLNSLRVPPGNRLEALKGSRSGQHSIRINDQWRICFHWNEGAENVEICDYHR